MEIIDISQELLSGSVFEGDTAPRLTAIKTVERDGFAVSDLTVCLHNGTHVDAPSHTFSGGKDVCAAELSVFLGECVVCTAENAEKNFAVVCCSRARRPTSRWRKTCGYGYKACRHAAAVL